MSGLPKRVSFERGQRLLAIGGFLVRRSRAPVTDIQRALPSATVAQVGKMLQVMRSWDIALYDPHERTWRLTSERWAQTVIERSRGEGERRPPTPEKLARREAVALQRQIMQRVARSGELSAREMSAFTESAAGREALEELLAKKRLCTVERAEGLCYARPQKPAVCLDTIIRLMAEHGVQSESACAG